MAVNDYQISEELPSVEDFNNLRDSVGWGRIENGLVAKGLSQSLYSICLKHNNEVIGCCRLVGDGALKVYVEELIVHPNHQKKGLGTLLMDKIMEYVKGNYRKGCSIGLFANTGLEKFYNKFGFSKRKEDMPGMLYRMP